MGLLVGSVVGIDPGLSGGLACLGFDGFTDACVMPTKLSTRGKNCLDARAMLTKLEEWQRHAAILLVIIEQVHAMPKQGIVSTFTFGRTVGVIDGVIQLFGASVQEPTPQAWKKEVLAGTQKDKNAAIGYVQSRYPKLSLLANERCRTPHDGIADAVCLAEYGRRVLVGAKSYEVGNE